MFKKSIDKVVNKINERITFSVNNQLHKLMDVRWVVLYQWSLLISTCTRWKTMF